MYSFTGGLRDCVLGRRLREKVYGRKGREGGREREEMTVRGRKRGISHFATYVSFSVIKVEIRGIEKHLGELLARP
jgi:hypothetical protein